MSLLFYLSSPSPFMLFLQELLTPVLFLPEPPSAYCSPHQTPLKCLKFHFRGWCKRDKVKGIWKATFKCLCWVGWRGGTAHLTSQRTSWLKVCSIHFSSLFFPEGPAAVPSAPAVAASRGFSIPLSSSLIAVPLKWGQPTTRTALVRNWAESDSLWSGFTGKRQNFQCGTLSYKVGDASGRGCGKESAAGGSSSPSFDSLMIGIRVSISDEYWSSPM